MKPLSTLNRPVLQTVDIETKEETVSFKERTDVTAVPAVGRGGRDDGGPRAGDRGDAEVRRRLARSSSCATTTRTSRPCGDGGAAAERWRRSTSSWWG